MIVAFSDVEVLKYIETAPGYEVLTHTKQDLSFTPETGKKYKLDIRLTSERYLDSVGFNLTWDDPLVTPVISGANVQNDDGDLFAGSQYDLTVNNFHPAERRIYVTKALQNGETGLTIGDYSILSVYIELAQEGENINLYITFEEAV